jgi:pSer/pThr/pTyr-binding forkhead associated (FHA) protein
MDVSYDEEFPPEAIKTDKLAAAFFIKTSKNFIKQTASAYIRALNGITDKPEYNITSNDEKINIGRDKRAQADDGFFRTNQIAFPSDSGNDSNKYVSRQHAHIEWNNDAGRPVIK